MKIIDILIAIAKKDKKINGLKFKFLDQRYFVEDFKIYDINALGFKNQLRNIGICFLNENVEIINEIGE